MWEWGLQAALSQQTPGHTLSICRGRCMRGVTAERRKGMCEIKIVPCAFSGINTQHAASCFLSNYISGWAAGGPLVVFSFKSESPMKKIKWKRENSQKYILIDSNLLMFPPSIANFAVSCSNVLSLQVLYCSWQPWATLIASICHLLHSTYFHGVFSTRLMHFK